MKLFITVFITVFLAEIGDKTQLATLFYAAGNESKKLLVFAAASLALIAVTAVSVLAAGVLTRMVDTRWLHMIAGAGFVLIGVWMLYESFQTSAAAGN